MKLTMAAMTATRSTATVVPVRMARESSAKTLPPSQIVADAIGTGCPAGQCTNLGPGRIGEPVDVAVAVVVDRDPVDRCLGSLARAGRHCDGAALVFSPASEPSR